MFCSKCGYNAGEANFCQHCGAPIKKTVEPQPVAPVAETVAETPVVEPVVEPVAETPVVEPVVEPVAETPVAPVVETVVEPVVETPVAPATEPVVEPVAPNANNNSGLTWNADNQQMWNTYQPTTKKSKAPLIIGITAVLLAVVALVGVFFIIPLFNKEDEEAANMNLSGANVLKSMTAGIRKSASELVNNVTVVNASDKKKFTGSFTVKKVLADDEDYMSYLNVDTVNYEMEIDSKEERLCGNIGFAKGSGNAVVNCTFYTDGKTFYVKLPELLGESLKSPIAVETNTDFNQVSTVMANLDKDTVKQYAKVMETVIGHVVDGLDYAIDKSVYQKSEGTVNISAGDMASDTVDSYTVTVNKQDVIDGFNKAVEAIFDDSSITPYITMLNTMGSKIDKETIKKEFADGLQDFASSMTFTMYAKNDAFAGISVDASSIITDVKGNLDIVALANDGVYNVLYVEAKGESGDYIKYSVDGRENVKKMSINADLDDAYMKFEFQYQVTDNSIEFKKLEISGRSGIQNVSFSMTAKYEGDDISSISMSDSDFANAVDVSNMSESQSAAITQKLLANAMKVLNDILSEKGLKEIGKLALE